MLNRIAIGIQARSTSRRFPNKVHQYLGQKTLLEHIVSTANNAAQYINNWGTKRILVEVAVLIPEGDIIKEKISRDAMVIEGSENDVLSRYLKLADVTEADYIVRLTADCPLIPSFLVSKLITLAVMNEYDYVSNVDERVRTAPDGHDCEVISRKALDYLAVHAHGEDREHVTTFLRRHPPDWLHWGGVVNYLDLSDMMLSVDTPEDLERVREAYAKVERARVKAASIFGPRSTHKL